MHDTKYLYRPRPLIFIGVVAVFGLCAGFFAHRANNNNQGLIINGLIELGQAGATVFYWSFFVGSALFVTIGLFALVRAFTSPRWVSLEATRMSAPKNGFSTKLVSIDYSSVRGLSIQEIHKNRFLIVDHVQGQLSIPESMLPNKKSFDDLCKDIGWRANT